MTKTQKILVVVFLILVGWVYLNYFTDAIPCFTPHFYKMQGCIGKWKNLNTDSPGCEWLKIYTCELVGP